MDHSDLCRPLQSNAHAQGKMEKRFLTLTCADPLQSNAHAQGKMEKRFLTLTCADPSNQTLMRRARWRRAS